MAEGPWILVIDDDPDILDALRLLLEDEGHFVETSEKAEYVEALRGSTGRLPSLIILDVLLSGKDGREICRQLKADRRTKHIPIIMVSAHPDAERTAMQVGADAFVAKPFAIDELLKAVNRVIQRSSQT